MFTRRVATFLLGVWIGCCLLADAFALQGTQLATRIAGASSGETRELVTKAGADNVGPLLKHLTNEQIRRLLDNWEAVQLLLAIAMTALLVLTDQRKFIAIGLCFVMGILTLVQHYFVTPDWIVAGRQVDFMPEELANSTRAQLWNLTQVYGAFEILKLLVGGALASYFFAMESTVKRLRRKEGRREEGELNAAAR